MSMDRLKYMIAPAHDNLANLRAIFYIIGATPTGFLEHDNGIERVKTGGLVVFGGTESFAWPFPGVELDSDLILSNAFCAGGRTGLVTVQSWINNPRLPYRYNATIHLPPTPSLHTPGSILINNYKITFSNAVRLA